MHRLAAPRPGRAHALLLLGGALLAGAAASVGATGPLSAQEPAVRAPGAPDTIPPPGPDTIPPLARPLPADTIRPPGPIYPDTLLPAELQEEIAALAEEVVRVVRNMPERPRPVPAGFETGVWEWDREALLATRALTLLELLEQIPGIVALRGGDYGQPTSLTAFGLDPGRIRLLHEGAEVSPLDGGVVDLSRIGLAALERVRVERRPGELRVETTGLQLMDARPLTLLEVGTGDLNTNVFRGTFAHPGAPGGNVVVALDRIDTGGPFREEPGASFGAHLRYTYFHGDRGGITWDFRRMTSNRPPELWDPESVERTDWGLKGRWELASGVIGDAFYHRSSLGVGGDVSPDAPPDTLVSVDPRSQVGVRLSADRGAWWAEGEVRRQAGPGWPSWVQAIRGGGWLFGYGGAAASVEREGWDDGSGVHLHARAWTAPVLGISLFAEVEDGRRGVPVWVPPTVPEEEEPEEERAGFAQLAGPARALRPGAGIRAQETGEEEPIEPTGDRAPSFTDRTGFRAGAEVRRGDAFAGAAFLSVRADSLHPMGLPTDREGIVTPGGTRTGVELSGRLPLTPILEGLHLEGSAQLWDREGAWRYLPERTSQAWLRFHDVFLETRNLEVWADVGFREREAMWLPLRDSGDPAALARVPAQQNWVARLQIRVVTVRIFVIWDNFTVRQDNQDFPDRLLPPTRALYGVRWTMWN